MSGSRSQASSTTHDEIKDLLCKLQAEINRAFWFMGVAQYWIFMACDPLEWVAYDPLGNNWMHLPKIIANESFKIADKESLAVGSELLVFAKDTSHVIYSYSNLTNSWSSASTKMNTPRCLFGKASLGKIAILAGGYDSNGKVLSSAELYDSETRTWVMLPSMKKQRKMCSAVFIGKKFYVIGGSNNTELLTCGEEYDLETRTWREIPNMFPVRSAHYEAPPMVAVVNNEIYAADYAEKVVKKYEKQGNLWVTVGKLPEHAVSVNGWGMAFRACGDRLIVINGGSRALAKGFIEINSWVPTEGPSKWILLARKHCGRFVYNCSVMGC